MSLKNAFKFLKKKFHLLFLLELGFWFSLLFFLIYIKDKLQSYMQLVSNYIPQLNALGEAAEQNTLDSTEALNLLSLLDAVSKEAMLFISIVIPLTMILLWSIFQATSFYIIKNKAVKHFKPFFIKFTFASLVLLGISYAMIGQILGNILEETPIGTALLQVVLVSFIGLYFLIGLSTTLSDAPLKQAIKQFFNIFIKKPYKVLLPYILWFVITTATFTMLISELLLRYLNDPRTSSTYVSLILYFLLFLLVGLLLKVFLQQKVAEIK